MRIVRAINLLALFGTIIMVPITLFVMFQPSDPIFHRFSSDRNFYQQTIVDLAQIFFISHFHNFSRIECKTNTLLLPRNESGNSWESIKDFNGFAYFGWNFVDFDDWRKIASHKSMIRYEKIHLLISNGIFHRLNVLNMMKFDTHEPCKPHEHTKCRYFFFVAEFGFRIKIGNDTVHSVTF